MLGSAKSSGQILALGDVELLAGTDRAKQDRRALEQFLAPRIETKIDRGSQKSGDMSQKPLDFLLLLRGCDGISLMGKKR